jgi:hypothetical protein
VGGVDLLLMWTPVAYKSGSHPIPDLKC